MAARKKILHGYQLGGQWGECVVSLSVFREGGGGARSSSGPESVPNIGVGHGHDREAGRRVDVPVRGRCAPLWRALTIPEFFHRSIFKRAASWNSGAVSVVFIIDSPDEVADKFFFSYNLLLLQEDGRTISYIQKLFIYVNHRVENRYGEIESIEEKAFSRQPCLV